MKKIITTTLILLFTSVALFAQSAEYKKYLSQAKEYEKQKKWCHALESYYDAIGTDDEPELKGEAWNAYNKLKDTIESGNPGYGKFNDFALHDEWKNLLIDAEQVGSTITPFKLTLGNLEQGDLDYATKTSSYYAKIDYTVSDRYINTIEVIRVGYERARKSDWPDLQGFPEYSVSYANDSIYNVNGALVYYHGSIPYNAFYYDVGHILEPYGNDLRSLYDYKINIIDDNGNEIVKGQRWLLGCDYRDIIEFTGITQDIMDVIDSGKGHLNVTNCYLEYGKSEKLDDKGGRTFIKNLPESEISATKLDVISWKNNENTTENNFAKCHEFEEKAERENILTYLESIPGQNYKMLQTEVTQAVYEAVMGENPSYNKGDNNPVEQVSWYDAICFCNKLSELFGLQPVYLLNGTTDINEWNEPELFRGTLEQYTEASGFRLPTKSEWKYAAKGGEEYIYSGGNTLDEVGWYFGNSKHFTHPVAEKKANGYGLYDMSGNVTEWVWDLDKDRVSNYLDRVSNYLGGNYLDQHDLCKVENSEKREHGIESKLIGFRIVCNSGSKVVSDELKQDEKKSDIEKNIPEAPKVEEKVITEDSEKISIQEEATNKIVEELLQAPNALQYIDQVIKDYDESIEKIKETKNTQYLEKLNSLKQDEWESDKEFEKKKKDVTDKFGPESSDTKEAVGKVQNEKKLFLKALNKTKFSISGDFVSIEFGDFKKNDNPKNWPVTVKSLDEIADYTYEGKYIPEENNLKEEYTEIENLRGNNGFSGEILYNIVPSEKKSGEYKIVVAEVKVFDSSSNKMLIDQNVKKSVGTVDSNGERTDIVKTETKSTTKSESAPIAKNANSTTVDLSKYSPINIAENYPWVDGKQDTSVLQNYQTTIDITKAFNGKLPKAGDVIHIVWKAVSDKDIEKLYCRPVDCSEKAGWWKELTTIDWSLHDSGQNDPMTLVEGIKAGQQFEIEKDIVLTEDSVAQVTLCIWFEIGQCKGAAVIKTPGTAQKKQFIPLFNDELAKKFTMDAWGNGSYMKDYKKDFKEGKTCLMIKNKSDGAINYHIKNINFDNVAQNRGSSYLTFYVKFENLNQKFNINFTDYDTAESFPWKLEYEVNASDFNQINEWVYVKIPINSMKDCGGWSSLSQEWKNGEGKFNFSNIELLCIYPVNNTKIEGTVLIDNIRIVIE